MVQRILNAANSLSLIGCAIIITAYFYARHQQRGQQSRPAAGHVAVHQKTLLFTATTNVFLNIGGLAYGNIVEKNRALCVMQALHITYFNLSNWLWTACIALNM